MGEQEISAISVVPALWKHAGFSARLPKNFWCQGAESNRGHPDFQSGALPLSYPGILFHRTQL